MLRQESSQHLTLGISTLSSSHKADEYKYWDLVEYNSPALTDLEKKYYLYAVCSKENQTGTFLLSETAIKDGGHSRILSLPSRCPQQRV